MALLIHVALLHVKQISRGGARLVLALSLLTNIGMSRELYVPQNAQESAKKDRKISNL
jgi:hypothetical protein